MATTWKLRDYLFDRRLKPAALARALEGRMSRTSIYNLVQVEPPKAVYLESLDAIVPALRELTGEDVQVGDLLEYAPDSAPELGMDVEDKAWLEGNLGGLGRHEPYAWQEGELEAEEPLRYVQGQGWVSG